LHNNSYPRTGTFSVVSWTPAVKCSADGDRLEDCSTRLARKRQNCCYIYIMLSTLTVFTQWQ